MLIFVRADFKEYNNLCYVRHKIYLCYIQSSLYCSMGMIMMTDYIHALSHFHKYELV
jgi:hypothetical protein